MTKSKWITALLVLAFLAGLTLLAYPTFSDYWNASRQSRAIATYVEEVDRLDLERKARMREEAMAYNRELLDRPNSYALPAELRLRYANTLDASGTGIMGYVDIPSIKVLLPIYHGTSENVLQTAIGHLDWTSLPVGGESTHAVISGHRGLPSAKLFTDLDRMLVGDIFMLRILDEVLTYEVDQILIVEPSEVASLLIAEGEDHCTLVTCTPYGVNTHRLLVRGRRIENLESAKAVRLISEAMQIEPLIIAVTLAVPMLLLLLLLFLLRDARETARRRKRRRREARQRQRDRVNKAETPGKRR